MKKFCIILIALFLAGRSSAQSCLPEGVTFTTQTQIDSFMVNYPGCVEIAGNVTIKGGNSINNLNGLSVLTSVGGNFTISWNYLMTGLTGLNNLKSIGGDLNIFGNTFLTSLTALDSIDAGSIVNLRVVGNDTLSTCAIKSICDYLASPNGTIEIHSNASGCNNSQEVEVACFYLSNGEIIHQPAFSIYPNPASTAITIELSHSTVNDNSLLTILNFNGQQLLQQEITEPSTKIDVSGLKSGIYIVKLVGEKEVQAGKFMKQ